MRRKRSAVSLKSDSGPEDFIDYHNNDDQASSIFMADATSSGSISDLEKESTTGTPMDPDQEEESGEVVTETTSLLGSHNRTSYQNGSTENTKEDLFPDVIYVSPARPHLPSPSTSNSRVAGSYPSATPVKGWRKWGNTALMLFSYTRNIFTV
jgi:hypothetical protein